LFQSLVYKVFVLLLKKIERKKEQIKPEEVPTVQKNLSARKKVVTKTKKRKSKKKERERSKK
jgi:hypothetical protein